jgi:hypothetical protein
MHENGGNMTTTTKLDVKLNFLKDLFFDHKYFEFTDSNDIRIVYSNEDIGDYIKANTVTLFAPCAYGGDEKLEIPGLMIRDVIFDCSIPRTTQDTLICDALLLFEAQSKLMNGDIEIFLNDSLPLSLNSLHDLTIFVDPTGHLEFIF